ncbi:hypothetical protein GCM10009771_06300 [Nesterenkonia flava]
MSSQLTARVSTSVPFRKASEWPTARGKARMRRRNRKLIARLGQKQRDAEARRAPSS